MSLFQVGNFKLHSGTESEWKIECDALTDEDWEALALVGSKIIPPFCSVEGVPRGGLKLAAALEKYVDSKAWRILVADDVLTTGASIKEQRADRPNVMGLVVFSRTSHLIPHWVQCIFQTHEAIKYGWEF